MRRFSIILVLIAVSAVGLASAPPAFAAPPPNDTPAGAEVIPPAGPFPYLSAITSDISDATVAGEPAPTCVGTFSRSIWYVFTPSASGTATLRTDAPGSTVSDPVMAVYTSGGGAGGPFTQVACDDDGGAGFASQVTLDVSAGTQYWIQVSKVGASAPGPGFTAIQLAVDLIGAPDNDTPAGAVLIPTAGPFPWFSPVIASIAAATTAGEPIPSCAGSFSRSVWYRFTPPYTNWYVIATDQTATSVADTVLAIYTSAGGAAGPFSEIACDDDGGIGGGGLSQVGVILYAGTGYGVYGYTPNGGYGVVGSNGGSNSSGFAGVFGGRVVVNGNFSVNGSKAFVIDHPLDPVNKLLYHFAVESPEVRNQYEGLATLDQDGRAVVQLPDYFDALNADDGIHYQVTCVGGYAPVYIAQEVAGNQFTIAGGAPGLKVSWQITALRDDPYLRDNRVETETDKTGDEIGRYWYPAGYGQPIEQSLLGDQGKGGLPDASTAEMKEVKP